MILFSRSFIRKRVISLATTAAVAATSFALAGNRARPSHAQGAMPVQYVANRLDYSSLAERDAAINRMMAAMTIKPTGNADHDFLAMMLPHQQGAIDIAKAELRYGHNEQLRRLAQEIVMTQGQEIALMRHEIGEDVTLSAAPLARPGSMVSSMTFDNPTARGSMNMN